MIKSESLYYFLHTARYGSISKAASKLNVTPPAISTAIKNLESDLNLTLLDRSSKGVQLTKEGLIIAEKAEFIIHSLEELENTAQNLCQNRQRPSLSIDTLYFFSEASIFNSLLEGISRDLYELFPHLDLVISEKPLRFAIQELASSSESIALLLLGSDSMDYIQENYSDHIKIQVIQTMPIYLLANKPSKWVSASTPSLTLEEIIQLPIIRANWLSSSTPTFDRLLTSTKTHTPNYVSIAPTLSALRILLRNDIGVVLGIKFSTNWDRFSENILYIPIATEASISLCFLHNTALDIDLQNTLLDIIKRSYTFYYE